MFASTLFGFVASLALTDSILAAPTSVTGLAERQVYSPPFIYPRAGDVWVVGMNHIVKWNMTNLEEAFSRTADLLLGYRTEGSDSLHLDVEHPLATNFPLGLGKLAVRLPLGTTPRTGSIVVLAGQYSNISPEFRIIAAPAVGEPKYVQAVA